MRRTALTLAGATFASAAFSLSCGEEATQLGSQEFAVVEISDVSPGAKR